MLGYCPKMRYWERSGLVFLSTVTNFGDLNYCWTLFKCWRFSFLDDDREGC